MCKCYYAPHVNSNLFQWFASLRGNAIIIVFISIRYIKISLDINTKWNIIELTFPQFRGAYADKITERSKTTSSFSLGGLASPARVRHRRAVFKKPFLRPVRLRSGQVRDASTSPFRCSKRKQGGSDLRAVASDLLRGPSCLRESGAFRSCTGKERAKASTQVLFAGSCLHRGSVTGKAGIEASRACRGNPRKARSEGSPEEHCPGPGSKAKKKQKAQELPAISAEEINKRYETLRSCVIEGTVSGREGLAVLRDRGLCAWLLFIAARSAHTEKQPMVMSQNRQAPMGTYGQNPASQGADEAMPQGFLDLIVTPRNRPQLVSLCTDLLLQAFSPGRETCQQF
jgi:hypothetical protein